MFHFYGENKQILLEKRIISGHMIWVQVLYEQTVLHLGHMGLYGILVLTH